jgi:hypothetical protein
MMRIFAAAPTLAALLVSTTAFAQVPPRDIAGPYADTYAAVAPLDGPMLVPPREVARMLRWDGFSLLGPPRLLGVMYSVAVIEPRRGEDGRVIVDARTGRLVRFIAASDVTRRTDAEISALDVPGASPSAPAVRIKPAAAPKLASRTPVAQPAPRPPVAPKAATSAPAPAEVKAEAKAVDSKPADAKPAEPGSIGSKPALQTSDAKSVEAKPATPASAADPTAARPAPVILPTQDMPPVVGLD